MIRYFSVIYEVVVDWVAARLGRRRNWCRAILERLPIEPNEVADLFMTTHRESAKTIASMMRQARGDFALFHAMKRDYNTQAVRVIAPLMIRPEFQIGMWRGIKNKLANVEQSPESLA